MSSQLTLFDRVPAPPPDDAHADGPAAHLRRGAPVGRTRATRRLLRHQLVELSGLARPGLLGGSQPDVPGTRGPAGVRAASAPQHRRHRSQLLRAHAHSRPAGVRRAAAGRLSLLLQGAGGGDRAGTGSRPASRCRTRIPVGRAPRRRSAGPVRRRVSGAHGTRHPRVPAVSPAPTARRRRLPRAIGLFPGGAPARVRICDRTARHAAADPGLPRDPGSPRRGAHLQLLERHAAALRAGGGGSCPRTARLR